ncbi:glutaminase [Rhodonellum psychrophilum GCM71 = DSM 17998]|uniref:Glutaminase n=2 Tax=Rhodonellum TaxID=336827 RepID=U5C6D2_9BACT|nr:MULTISPECIES: glutaminase [Rhodonellum]ERM84506.1 glutaminase [Rhodonellum psychrophilum GCM71 = DSM 17998]MDO9553431.1 glutaminase [Rhodonellum sp.]SDZ01660.1 L-glutaminase [Rhodonellum ikkaensis]
MDYQELIEEVYHEVNKLELKGKVADYIPELAKVNPDQFGIALVDLEGKVYGVGDYKTPFSIQSISKVHTLTMVFHVFNSKLWTRVNVEPSGNPFNSIAQLEFEKGIPRNPFINAGALVIADALTSKFEDPKTQIINFINDISGDKCVSINEEVRISELKHSERNIAMAYFLKAYDNFDNDVQEVLETYVSQCAIEMSCVDLAKSFSFLANDGYSIFAKRNIVTESNARRINALMLTCGFYDESGEFAYRVGLPGKSGVGGGVGAVMPHKFSVAVWSPELNEKGNSVKSIKALELLTDKLKFSLF